MTDKIKLTAVNYLNTFPFKYGLEKYADVLNWLEIDYATPFECAQKLVRQTTHIALAPVAVLAYQPDLKIISDFCLSTNDEVHSVKLYARRPIQDIQSVVLDYQSLSSVSLVKVLMKHYWKKEVHYIKGQKGFENDLQADAMVVIGDRTFELNGHFEYEYDLGKEWYNFYGNPFVFAAWISNIHLNEEQIYQLNTAFEYGIRHINDVVTQTLEKTSILNFLDENERKEKITRYLTQNMHYHLDEQRKQSARYFLHLLKDIQTEPVSVI
ncbi:MAG: hypothetical protein Fur0023_06550 [Bacteroidia bacterium]